MVAKVPVALRIALVCTCRSPLHGIIGLSEQLIGTAGELGSGRVWGL